MAKQTKLHSGTALIVLVLAWLIPGAGHVYIGKTVRGIIIFLTVGVTFWAGVAAGGVMTVDKRAEHWWFVAEMFTGVHGLVGWHRSASEYRAVDAIVSADTDYQAQVRALAGRYRGRVPSRKLAELHQEYAARELEKKGVSLVMPAETIARAYAGVAGLLNVLCVFDAVMLALIGVVGETVSAGEVGGASAKGKGKGKKR